MVHGGTVTRTIRSYWTARKPATKALNLVMGQG
jgi:hypothetical protein